MAPEAQEVSAMMVLRELDQVNRRIDSAEARISSLDEHGSRGLAGLQVQLQELAKDMAALDTTFTGFRRDLRSARWQLALAYIGGLVPLYAFVAQQFLK